MKVLVLGAGVVGVATAYALMKAGHRVVVIDRREGPGLETSFANGGQISASHAEPWANPAAIGQMLRWILRDDAPLLFRFRVDPALWAWGLRFLANCTPARTRANTERILRIAVYSRICLNEIAAAEGLDFDRLRKGILMFYRSDKDFRHGVATAALMKAAGCACEVLDRAACVALEPALADAAPRLFGGVFAPDDESGDAYKFTTGLAAVAAAGGVEFRYEVAATGLRRGAGRIEGVETDRGTLTADRYVLALGSYSPLLLKPLGLSLPIYPAKGYSATLDLARDALAPTVSLMDVATKIVYSRLGDRLRVAGTGEFAGYDTGIDPRRSRALVQSALDLFPRLGTGDDASFWAGLRPSTPDGVPIIGASRFANLILNTGHGTLGWTLACGSARIVADLIDGRTPAIDLAGMGAERFARFEK